EDRARYADAMAQAVQVNRVNHVVFLSSIGSHLGEGTGPIAMNRYVEATFTKATPNITLLRPSLFFENWAASVATARDQAILPNFLPPNRKIPQISTVDVGRFAAEALLHPSKGRSVLNLAGPEDYSPEDIADAFSAALGRHVTLQTHPTAAIEPA